MWTPANIITVGRIGTLPMIVLLMWPGIENRHTCFWAAMLYGVAGVLDMVDGALARGTNTVTVLGKFLDPLADKLLHLVTLIALLQLPGPRIPPWVVMIILTRELAITGLRGIAITEGIVIAAGEGGKIKTTFGTLGMAALLIHYTYLIDFGFIQVQADFNRVGLWLTLLSLGFSISSALSYVHGFIGAMQKKARALQDPTLSS